MRRAVLAREVAGWLGLIAGMGVFGITLGLLMDQRLFEAVPATFIGFVVFRGGVHLLKSSLALQAVLAAEKARESVARGRTGSGSGRGPMAAHPSGRAVASSQR